MKSSNIWKIQLLLDGIDVSLNLSGKLSIEREENAASVAEFTLMPFSGPISVTKWIGKAVEIYYLVGEEKYVLFKGVVDEPVYDPTTKLTHFTCSDQLQETIEQLARAEINWGYWSEAVFSESTDNWRYAQDKLSTIPFSLSLDLNQNLKLTPWAAKSLPDYAFTEDDLVYQSLKVQLANRRQMHNSTEINFQYRYSLFKQREIHFDYRYPLSICEQLQSNATMPNVEMITKAIEGTQWLLKEKPDFKHQYESGWYVCDGAKIGFMITPELQAYLVREAQFTLMKRFVQTITEEYQIELQAPQSLSQLGTLPFKTQFSFETNVKAEDFTNIIQYQAVPEGAKVDELGDYALAQDNAIQFSEAITTALNLAKTQILEVHRQNLISFQVALMPQIETQHTVQISTKNVVAQGKVKQVTHQCDFDEGSALSTITLAISRTDSALEVLENPLSLTHQIDLGRPPEVQQRIELPTHFGGATDATEFNNTWDGYSGNKSIQLNPVLYPEQFALTMPEITQAPQHQIINQAYQIAIPNELLEMRA